MLQLAEFGFTDYDKNLRLVREENQSDINTIRDKLSIVDSPALNQAALDISYMPD